MPQNIFMVCHKNIVQIPPGKTEGKAEGYGQDPRPAVPQPDRRGGAPAAGPWDPERRVTWPARPDAGDFPFGGPQLAVGYPHRQGVPSP